MRNLVPITVTAVAALVLTSCAGPSTGEEPSSPDPSGTAETIEVGLLLAGDHTDGGFMQAGYEGVAAAAEDFGVEFDYIEGIEPETPLLADALRELADAGPDLVIAHGGQNTEAITTVAAEYPDIRFAITQSDATGANLSSYEVLQEQSAWLAGAAAGLLTQTDVVGHMSGIRVTPGLKGRAAYVDGVHHTNPDATVLTNFSGDQDDVELAERIARAEIEAGADHIFTMLNAGRPGVAAAMAGTEARQFGNVVDWTEQNPEIFVGSAVADSGHAAYLAIEDVVNGTFVPGEVTQIGLETPEAVRLTLAPDVPQDVVDQIEDLGQQIIDGQIEVSTSYDGPEFEVD